MASTYLTRTNSSAGSGTKFTISTWVKKGTNASGIPRIMEFYHSSSYYISLRFRDDSSNRLDFYSESNGAGVNLRTNRSFRDVSAWYHIVLSVDTTDATADDRMKMYINGVQETSFALRTNPSSSEDLGYNTASATNYVGRKWENSDYFNGSMAHFHFIDGTAYDASAFGETDSASGIWKPKSSPSVTYGTNGFFLDFANSSDLGNDVSGNNNDFTVNGTGTQTLDTPSNVFATLNGLIRNATGSTLTLSNGNLQGYSASTSVFGGFSSTLGVSSGKYYWEYKLVSTTAGLFYTAIGVTSENYLNYISAASRGDPMAGGTSSSKAESYEYLVYNGKKQHDGTATAHGDTMTTGDIAMVALDLDNNYIYFGKNGTWQNSSDPTSGSSGTGAAFSLTTGLSYSPIVDQYHTNTTAINFGNGYFGTTAVSTPESDSAGLGKFEYSVPSGYYALCTKNIADYG